MKPENVVYTPARTTPVTRVWLESECFCTPTPPLTGSQTLSGALTIIHASTERVGGRVTLSARGHTPPINYVERHVELDAFFEVALTRTVR